MKDKVSIPRVARLHPCVVDVFTEFIEEAEKAYGMTFRVTQGLRTFEEQNALYAQGRTKPGMVVTKARGGQSYHNYGLAVDLVRMVGDQPDWKYSMSHIKDVAEKHGLLWGGLFSDYPHFELAKKPNWRILLERHNKKKFITNTTYIIL